jgi:hypothetical protein
MTAELIEGRATFPGASIVLLTGLSPHTLLVIARKRHAISAENCIDS